MTDDSAYERILHALGIALVEIRSAKNLHGAQILADIFHNVPSSVANRKPAEDIENEVLQRADRLQVRLSVEKLFNV